ncbi:MAG: complex I subunit 5 family protein [Acetatifactor sp.]
MDILLLVSLLLPAVAGIWLLLSSFSEHLRAVKQEPRTQKSQKYQKQKPQNQKLRNLDWLHPVVAVVLTVSVALVLTVAWTGERSMTLFTLVDLLPVYFKVDEISRWFVTIVSVIWLAAGFYSFVYLKHEGEEKRYFGFYLLLYGVLVGLDFSGNLVTMYLFYELMTLVSMPLVLHNGSREAIMAALKYLFYSMCGAYGGLFGIYVLYRYCDSLTFIAGGSLNMTLVSGHEGFVLVGVFVMILGFGVKAGMLPLHAWLPSAHPVAPSPASAVLSGVIVKSGVLALIRGVFYVVGTDFIRGTWVQYTWMILALLTVFMGSMLAFREQGFKKRLAYSTVSQVSYILFGLSLLTPMAYAGALLHTAIHAVVKCGLFLVAGVFLYCFEYTKVDQLKGLGKRMPAVMWCYTLFSLALIGIPPTGGFISKWYLAEGALNSDTGVISWLGPIVLLLSALLTAGYLLPIVMKGFFPGEEADEKNSGKVRISGFMLIPLIVLATLAVLLGVFPQVLNKYAVEAAGVFGWEVGL